MRISKNFRGLTYMEIVVSLVILAVVLLGIHSVFVAGRRFNIGGNLKFEATDFARQTLERLKDHVRQDNWLVVPNDLRNGTRSDPLPPTPAVQGDLSDRPPPLPALPRTYQVADIDGAGPLTVRIATVTVQWERPQP